MRKTARKKNGKPKGPISWFGSDRLRGREDRTRVKRALRQGEEPQPKYTTGKFWTD